MHYLVTVKQQNKKMKNQNSHHTCKITSVFVALLLACFGLASAAQAAGHPSIVGLWTVEYYQSTGEFLFETHDQWHSDGLEFEINSIAPGAVCAGTFKQAADGTVHLHHVIYTFDATGVLNGTIDETQLDTVAADGNSYSGTFDQKFYDLGGNFLFEVTGTQAATRILPER